MQALGTPDTYAPDTYNDLFLGFSVVAVLLLLAVFFTAMRAIRINRKLENLEKKTSVQAPSVVVERDATSQKG